MSRTEEHSSLEMHPFSVSGLYLLLFSGYGVAYWLLHHLWGSYFLITFQQLTGRGFVLGGLGHVWFIFAWAIVSTLVGSFITKPVVNDRKSVLFAKAWWLSLNAGLFEEMIYRWLQFGIAMVLIPFFNVITFGLEKWGYVHVLIPVADFMTLHQLHPYLVDHGSWVFGAAVVCAAVSFRDAHEHLGLFGMINAWFGGMVLFWLMCNYGLLTAIVAHIIYDVLVFSTSIAVSERQRPLFSAKLIEALIGR